MKKLLIFSYFCRKFNQTIKIWLKNSKEIVELLRSFNKSLNQTVIIITHDERIALDADRVIAVEDGKIVKDEVIRQ